MELITAKALAEQCPFPQAARPAPRHEGRTCGATVRVRRRVWGLLSGCRAFCRGDRASGEWRTQDCCVCGCCELAGVSHSLTPKAMFVNPFPPKLVGGRSSGVSTDLHRKQGIQLIQTETKVESEVVALPRTLLTERQLKNAALGQPRPSPLFLGS